MPPSTVQASLDEAQGTSTPSRRRAWLLPLLPMGLYVVLAVWCHYDRAWQGDEWGSWLALSETYQRLLGHFGGWQTMNFYLAGLKAIHQGFGGTNWLLVLPGIVCGAWLVWIVGALTRRLGGGSAAAFTASLLVAVNSDLVHFGSQIRSYIFLATFSAAMMLGLFNWRERGRWRDGIWCGVCGALALLAHLNATYTFAAVGILAMSWTLGRVRRHEPGIVVHLVRLAVPVMMLGGLAAAAYLPQLADIRRFREMWSGPAPIPLTFLPNVLKQFFGSAPVVLVFLAALGYAAWRMIREQRPSQWLLLAAIIVVASISLAGVSHYPNAYGRFLIATLPWLIIGLADGLWCRAEGGLGRALAGMTTALLVLCSLITLQEVRQRQHALPWHRISQAARREATPDTRFFLIGPGVHLAALQVYGVQSTNQVVPMLEALPADRPLSVLSIDTTQGSETGIRYTKLEGAPQMVAATLRSQLIEVAGGRIAPELTDVYRQLAELSKWTGRGDEAIVYERLMMKSQGINPKLRVR